MQKDFGVRKIDGGWSACWKGEPICVNNWSTRGEARAYLKRLDNRYPNGSVEIILTEYSKPKQRGGPWRWTIPGGETGVVHTGRLSDAKEVLRYNMKRKRLPLGTQWELVQDEI